MEPHNASVMHPTAEQLAAHLDRRLEGAEREGVVHHLVRCAACRRDLTASLRLVRESPSAGRPARVLGLMAVIATAAAAVVMLIPAMPSPDARRERAQRIAHPDVVPPIEVVAPADGDTVAGDVVRLSWRSAGRDVSYEIILQDSVGHLVHTLRTTDSVAAISGEVGLARGQAYYWSVDALRPNGTSTRSRAYRFIR